MPGGRFNKESMIAPASSTGLFRDVVSAALDQHLFSHRSRPDESFAPTLVRSPTPLRLPKPAWGGALPNWDRSAAVEAAVLEFY
jgi:hypothetical protein